MRAVLVLALAAIACNPDGDGGSGGATAECAVCAVSFTDAECQDIADDHGCATGEAYPDELCDPPTQGCTFTGCPPGPVLCATADGT